MPVNHKWLQNKINRIIKTNNGGLIHIYHVNEDIRQNLRHSLSRWKDFIDGTITIKNDIVRIAANYCTN